jgi:hypothetical protein
MEYLVFLRRKGMKSSRKVAHEFFVADLKPLQRTFRFFSDTTASRTSVSDLSIRFDHKPWWEENGFVVRHLLEGSDRNDKADDSICFVDKNNASSPNNIRNNFERVYSSDAVYQDLFIDTPPCRDAVKFSFELIARYWEIKVIEWGPPTVPLYNNNRNVEKIKRSEQGSRTEDCDVCLRVPYTVAQMPRLFSSKKSLIWGKILGFKYEGWIDLYLRREHPILKRNADTTITKNRCVDGDASINDTWEVYRHDDRVRIILPKSLQFDNKTIGKDGDSDKDVLSIVETIPLISIIFQRFRSAHGKLVHHFVSMK